jgi:uncharacterized protein
MQKWLKYDPFNNDECCNCIALPVCMGGCAHHALDKIQHENRCGTFRHNYKDKILAFISATEQAAHTDELVSMSQSVHKMEIK